MIDWRSLCRETRSIAATESLNGSSASITLPEIVISAENSPPPKAGTSSPALDQDHGSALAFHLEQQIKIIDALLGLSDDERLAVLSLEMAYLDLPALLDHYLEDSSHLENDLKNPGGVRQIVEASRARYLATKAGVPAAQKSRPIGPVVEGSPEDRFPAQVRVLGSKNDRESRRADGVQSAGPGRLCTLSPRRHHLPSSRLEPLALQQGFSTELVEQGLVHDLGIRGADHRRQRVHPDGLHAVLEVSGERQRCVFCSAIQS